MMVPLLWLYMSLLVGSLGAINFDRSECRKPAETSRCRAAISMWYFNETTQSCGEFIWGGCPGNLNKFPNRETCIRSCHPETCLLPAEVGPCRANIKLWFYDITHRKCNEFSYGGCEGNQNKFGSKHDCETACAGTNLLCDLGPEFHTIGDKAVHDDYREKDWYVNNCEGQCRESCLVHHQWGTCLAYSTRKRWYACECYLFDRQISEFEFDEDTSGASHNRMCEDGRLWI